MSAWRLVSIALVSLLAGCDQVAPEPRNVVLILVDTLRADHLGTYGYARETSPHIDAFAQESLVFEQARSQAPCTYPSVNSLLTSRPVRHLIQRIGIPPRIPTLATLLRDSGWRTAAVSASPIVRRSPSIYNPTGGFDRGFETFHEDCESASAACVNQAATRLLSELDEPRAPGTEFAPDRRS